MASRRNEKRRATRGAKHPEGRGSQRWHARPMNPLDLDDAGKNKRDLARATRRTSEPTAAPGSTTSGGKRVGRSVPKHAASKRRKPSKRVAAGLDAIKSSAAKVMPGRKGGPGRRRSTPKNPNTKRGGR
jgi:hypothetical protein